MIQRSSLPKSGIYKEIPVSLKGMPNQTKQQIQEQIGILPFVWYNGYQVRTEDIKLLEISSNSFVPEFSMIFSDSLDLFIEEGFPLDDSIISIFARSTSSATLPLRLDFKIIEFNLQNPNSSIKTYSMKGILNLNGIYIRKWESFRKLTSFELFKKIAGELGLGFAHNVSSSSDSMTWINPGQSKIEFLQEVTKNSYIADEAFLYSFIDLDYNLVYIDIETQLREDISNQLGAINYFPYSRGFIEEGTKETSAVGPLILTNQENLATAETYFRKYLISNTSTGISLKNGYQKLVYFYDSSEQWSGDKRAGTFHVFGIDSITTPGAEKVSIILKGAPQDEEFFKKHSTHHYSGFLDRSNVHVDYRYSNVQNYQNIQDLKKIEMRINLHSPNYNLQRFQKVQIMIVNETGPGMISNEVNRRLSGSWLITSMSYVYSQNGFEQQLTLVKRELNVENLTA